MLDGLITFFASHHAIRADKVLRENGFTATLVAGPKELSPNCGTAVRFEYDRRVEALSLLAKRRVEVEEVHRHLPRSDAWRASGKTSSG